MCAHDKQRRALVAALAVAPLFISGCGGEEEEVPTTPAPGPTANRIPIVGAGCYRTQYAGAQPDGIGCGVLPNFGDPTIDSQWAQEIQIQAQFFSPVLATVLVLDECSPANGNAFALPEGYILMGRYFARQLVQKTGTTLPIAGVLAHEWGHRAQFTYGWTAQTEPTARRTELEADMWSGLYMGISKLWTGPYLQSFFQTLIDIGDYNFNSPNHHGTPNQRYAAGATGLTLALQLMQTQTRLSYPQIHALFVNEITRIVSTIQKSEEPQLKQHLEKAGESLAPEAREIAKRMDTDWIRGVATGTRELSELVTMPALPLDVRMNLGPY